MQLYITAKHFENGFIGYEIIITSAYYMADPYNYGHMEYKF